MHPSGTLPRQGIRYESRAIKVRQVAPSSLPHTCSFEGDIMLNSCILLKHNAPSTRTPPERECRPFHALLKRSCPAPYRTAFLFSAHRPMQAQFPDLSSHRPRAPAHFVPFPRTHTECPRACLIVRHCPPPTPILSYGLRTSPSLRAPIIRTTSFRQLCPATTKQNQSFARYRVSKLSPFSRADGAPLFAAHTRPCRALNAEQKKHYSFFLLGSFFCTAFYARVFCPRTRADSVIKLRTSDITHPPLLYSPCRSPSL